MDQSAALARLVHTVLQPPAGVLFRPLAGQSELRAIMQQGVLHMQVTRLQQQVCACVKGVACIRAPQPLWVCVFVFVFVCVCARVCVVICHCI